MSPAPRGGHCTGSHILLSLSTHGLIVPYQAGGMAGRFRRKDVSKPCPEGREARLASEPSA
jgi:hypothetical protein